MKLEPGAKVTSSVTLLRLLGEGGMGAVWVAEHSGLGTEVAVKFLLGEYAKDPGIRARFSQEAAAGSQVKSAHVAKTYDYGLTDTDVPFIVMELLEGTDLAARLKEEGALPPATVITVVSQLCKALERAHEKGVIHRDIKPGNIFLASEGGEIFVKLLDFGIAKTEAMAKKVTADRRSTMVGETLGTPYYMSPEQFRSAKTIDARSDLWSVGVVAYEALTGELPFTADTVAALAIVVSEGLARAPTEIAPALPPAVDAWFAKACARNPDDRFQTARELAEGLRGAFAGGPVAEPGVHATTGLSRRVTISSLDETRSDAEAVSLRETAFSSSGAGRRPATGSSRAVVMAISLVLLGLAGGLGAWKLRGSGDEGRVLGAPGSSAEPASVVAASASAAEPLPALTASPPSVAPAVSAATSAAAPASPSPRVTPATATPIQPAPSSQSAPAASASARKGAPRDRDIW